MSCTSLQYYCYHLLYTAGINCSVQLLPPALYCRHQLLCTATTACCVLPASTAQYSYCRLPCVDINCTVIFRTLKPHCTCPAVRCILPYLVEALCDAYETLPGMARLSYLLLPLLTA